MRRVIPILAALCLFALAAAPLLADTIFLPLGLRSYPPPSLALVVRGADNLSRIYEYRPLARELLPLLEPGAVAQSPSWAPDRMRLAYVAGEGLRRDIYVYDTRFRRHAQLTDGPSMNTHPAWSPDGNTIAYTCWRNSAPHVIMPHVCLMAADGSNQRIITNAHDRCETPAWSPGGTRIAFSRAGGDGRRNICHAAVDGSDMRCVTSGSFQDTHPAWSPDSMRIAFSSPRSDTWAVYLVPANGGPLTPLTTGDINATDPAWSPDGTRIAVTRWSSSEHSVVEIIRLDGVLLDTIVAPGGASAASPAWR